MNVVVVAAVAQQLVLKYEIVPLPADTPVTVTGLLPDDEKETAVDDVPASGVKVHPTVPQAVPVTPPTVSVAVSPTQIGLGPPHIGPTVG